MKNYKITCLTSIIVLSITQHNVAAQFKYEREYNLSKEKVPGISKSFIDSCCSNSKVKWFGEESLTGKTIEAKINYKGSLYSIEFDTLGHIQDVEKKISINEIPKNARLTMMNKLDSIFIRHKIEKIQVQWIGSNQVQYQLIAKNNSTLPHTINYEMIVKGRKDQSTKMYEILFTMEGGILNAWEIVQRNTDNLDY